MKQEVEDQIVKSVLAKYVERSNTGLKKYGTPLTRNDLTLDKWITHLQEELMDATLYLQKIMDQNKEITKIVKETPNDTELGMKIRNLIR